jgi:hypothetical protein
MRKGLVLLLSIILLAQVGCVARGGRSGLSPGGAILATDYYGVSPNLEKRAVTLDKADFLEALGLEAPFNTMRAIQIHLRNDNPNRPTYHYRLFDIRESDAFWRLGLRNSDVLVAAHGYVIFNPAQFFQYVTLLPNQEQGSIEIRRAGKPIRFEYSFR